MTLWNNVCKTDPAHTKHVGQRGGFTAIDAMYQVQCATEQFGPAGIGWGWEFELIFPPNDSILAKVTVWHGKKDQTVSQVGQKKLGGERIDEDAAKKAVTDGLTKCLSYLGFNADVFLGKFDDNKYVEAMKAEHNPIIKEFRTFKYKAEIDLGNIMDEKGLTTWVKANQKTIEDAKMNSDTKADAMALMATYSKVKAEVTPTP
jgi:hypothetical protein